MEESDSGQQPKRCSCGFWGSPQTSGLCSKCYKAVVQEKTQDTLDAKAELMRERQSAYSGHDSLGGASSSFLATSCSQSSASDVEKAGELIRQAVRNSNNANNSTNSSQSVDFSTNNSSSKSVATNTDTQINSSTTTSKSATTGSGNSADDSDCASLSENKEKTVSVSSSTSNTDSVVAVAMAANADSSPQGDRVDIDSVATKGSSLPSDATTTTTTTAEVATSAAAAAGSTASLSDPTSTSCPTTPDKRGLKRDSSALDEGGTGTPDSTPEKPGTKSRKRCNVCKCKLELAQRTIGRCRCDNMFCSLHRLPELHNCDFDHKEDGRREAREKMVKPTRHLGTSFKRLGSDS